MFVHDIFFENNNFYLINRLKENKYLINYHYYGDHLSKRDRLSLIKRLYDGSDVIFFSGEAQEHSWKYIRPSWLAKAYFTHIKTKKSIYFNLFLQEALDIEYFYQSNFPRPSKKNGKTVLIASNTAKINQFKNNFKDIFTEVDLYGTFSKNVPSNNFHQNDSGSNVKNYMYDSQHLSSQYTSAICIDNSFENGYLQGTPMMHLHAGTVPIYHGPEYCKNFIKEDYFIDLKTYAKLKVKQRSDMVMKVSEKIDIAQGNFLTTLTLEYLDFLKKSLSSDLIDFNDMIQQSSSFRQRFLKL